MAITVTDKTSELLGGASNQGRAWAFSNLNIKVFEVGLDSVYPAGGEAFDPTSYGFNSVLAVIPACAGSDSTTATGGYVIGYDHAAKKIQVFGGASAASGDLKVLDKADLHKVIVRVLVIGTVA